jgi:hypothetical protein
MNVTEITGQGGQETLARYIGTTFALTCATAWLVIACQLHGPFVSKDSSFSQRVGWPMFFLIRKFKEKTGKGSMMDVEMTERD